MYLPLEHDMIPQKIRGFVCDPLNANNNFPLRIVHSWKYTNCITQMRYVTNRVCKWVKRNGRKNCGAARHDIAGVCNWKAAEVKYRKSNYNRWSIGRSRERERGIGNTRVEKMTVKRWPYIGPQRWPYLVKRPPFQFRQVDLKFSCKLACMPWAVTIRT